MKKEFMFLVGGTENDVYFDIRFPASSPSEAWKQATSCFDDVERIVCPDLNLDNIVPNVEPYLSDALSRWDKRIEEGIG